MPLLAKEEEARSEEQRARNNEDNEEEEEEGKEEGGQCCQRAAMSVSSSVRPLTSTNRGDEYATVEVGGGGAQHVGMGECGGGQQIRCNAKGKGVGTPSEAPEESHGGHA
jgi:hypothetical protein